ncbi:MAG: hypothetical protein ACOZQL_32760 [Myxococcota bacterium]
MRIQAGHRPPPLPAPELKAPPKKPKDRAVLTIATVNDDFTDRKTNVPHVKAGVVLVQEAKNTRLRDAVSERKYGVHQARAEDKSGSAVVWKKQDTGLRWHAPKGSIDGFLASRSVHFEHLRRLPKGSSDHHPVLARITLRKSS